MVIGGKLISVGTNALLGKGDFIVAEADESDGSFLRYSPTIAVVTNIDREHLDFYADLTSIKRVFLEFIDRIPFYGLAVLCLDNDAIQGILPQVKKRYATYGTSPHADFQIRDVSFAGRRSRFSVLHRGKALGAFVLNLPGIHNVTNAAAGIAVGVELDIPVTRIQEALENLSGVQRRLEVKGERNGVTVVDDYGHHPTEIKVTLAAAKACWPERRIVVVFQPHRYSRTRALFDDFTRAFYQSDVLYRAAGLLGRRGEDRRGRRRNPVRGHQGPRSQAGPLGRNRGRGRGQLEHHPATGRSSADPRGR